jgi:aminoglycoside N3'-acetyltransferase
MTDAATRTSLADQLRCLGVHGGVPLMLHSSLRKVGPIVGGAEALLDALVDAISPGGTLLMLLGSDTAWWRGALAELIIEAASCFLCNASRLV